MEVTRSFHCVLSTVEFPILVRHNVFISNHGPVLFAVIFAIHSAISMLYGDPAIQQNIFPPYVMQRDRFPLNILSALAECLTFIETSFQSQYVRKFRAVRIEMHTSTKKSDMYLIGDRIYFH